MKIYEKTLLQYLGNLSNASLISSECNEWTYYFYKLKHRRRRRGSALGI